MILHLLELHLHLCYLLCRVWSVFGRHQMCVTKASGPAGRVTKSCHQWVYKRAGGRHQLAVSPNRRSSTVYRTVNMYSDLTSDGPVRIEFSVKPCSKNLRPGIRSLERSAKCAPHPGYARSSCRVWTLRAFQKTFLQKKKKTSKRRQVGGRVSAGTSELASAMNAHKQYGWV